MPSFPRDELEEMMQRWMDINKRCEEQLDWMPMADMYTEDATYGWNVGPNDEFMAVGRDQIREYALGYEMEGLGGWTYPYQRVLIDEAQGEILGLWKQMADATRPDGSHYEIAGLGGSWFRYAGDFKWSWQRDFFDVGNATATYFEMINAGALTPGMTKRMEKATSGNVSPATTRWDRPRSACGKGWDDHRHPCHHFCRGRRQGALLLQGPSRVSRCRCSRRLAHLQAPARRTRHPSGRSVRQPRGRRARW